MVSRMLRIRLGQGALTCIASKKDLQTLAVIAFGNAKIWVPFAVNKDLVDLDLMLLAESAQNAVDKFVRVDGPGGELVDCKMGREGIATILVDQESSVDGECMPEASAVELTCKLLRFEMDEV